MQLEGTHFGSELAQQADAVRRFLAREDDALTTAARAIKDRSPQYVVVVGRGSSCNACHYARYLIGHKLGLPVVVAAPSLTTMYGASVAPEGAPTLLVAISQSGASPDVRAVVCSARRGGIATLAITNDAESPLADAADMVLSLDAGTEQSVAAVKTYTTSLAALAALVAEVRDDERARKEIRQLPALIKQTTAWSLEDVERADAFAGAPSVVVMARGYNYATAREIALKLREVAGTSAEAFSSASLLHGSVAVVSKGTVVVVVRPPGSVHQSVLEVQNDLDARGASTVTIADTGDATLRIPSGVPEWLSPMVTIIPGQVLALHHGLQRGRNVDAPPGVKKVTLTY